MRTLWAKIPAWQQTTMNIWWLVQHWTNNPYKIVNVLISSRFYLSPSKKFSPSSSVRETRENETIKRLPHTVRGHTSHLVNGFNVSLGLSSIAVKKACVMTNVSEDVLNALQETPLSTMLRQDEFLLFITEGKLNPKLLLTPYPYKCPGQKRTSDTLGDTWAADCYSWDTSKWHRTIHTD